MGEGKGEKFVPPKSCGQEVGWFLKKLSPQNKKDLKRLNIFDLKEKVEARGLGETILRARGEYLLLKKV